VVADQITKARVDLRQEYRKMQRAQFVLWLATRDEGEMAELERLALDMEQGEGVTLEEVRRQQAARFAAASG
jgi:hypothetical protein